MNMNKKTIITILLTLVAMVGQAQTIPTDWFKTDTITIRGRIEGYDAERFGFTSMTCYLYDIMEKDNNTLVMDITPDGFLRFRSSSVLARPSILPSDSTSKDNMSATIIAEAVRTWSAG